MNETDYDGPSTKKTYRCGDQMCGALDCTNCYPWGAEDEEGEDEQEDDDRYSISDWLLGGQPEGEEEEPAKWSAEGLREVFPGGGSLVRISDSWWTMRFEDERPDGACLSIMNVVAEGGTTKTHIAMRADTPEEAARLLREALG